MARYIASRLGQGLIVLLLSSVAIFAVVRMTGNPVYLLLPADASAEDVSRLTTRLGLDRPLPEQYAKFIWASARGDFGNSIQGRAPVGELIAQRLPNSLKLGGLALLLAILVGLPLGVMSAVHRGRAVDLAARTVALLGQSVPSFWLAIVLVAVFAGGLKWLPASGSNTLDSFILPVFCLAVTGFLLSGTVRFVRSGMLEVLDSEYVKLARARGLPERTVIWKHAFRNATIPLITYLGFYLTLLLGGASLVIETVFAWPGIGTLLYNGILARDYPVVQALVVMYVGGFVVANLLIDILYAYVDPTIRY